MSHTAAEPTTGAMKAAKKLCNAGAPQSFVLNYAAFIDAETGLPELIAERDRLAAIVAKLPVTADGVPMVPGMEVFRLTARGTTERHEVFMVKSHHWVDDSMIHFGPKSPIFSTTAATTANPEGT